MSRRILNDVQFYRMLDRFDKDLVERIMREGCPCGGRLHRCDYPRKPRGLPAGLDWDKRFSLCCDREGCRKRRTPPSVRFLGRKVYVGVWVVLVAAMSHGLTGKRRARLRKELALDRRTLERWREWWLETFAKSPFWKAAGGRLASLVDAKALPASLVARFAATTRDGLLRLMEFLLPVTIGWMEIDMTF